MCQQGVGHPEDRHALRGEQVPAASVLLELATVAVVPSAVHLDAENSVYVQIEPAHAPEVYLRLGAEARGPEVVARHGLEDGLRMRVDELDDAPQGPVPSSSCTTGTTTGSGW